MSQIVVGGRDFAEAVRGILPRSPSKDLGGVAIGPGAAGFIRLTSFYASAEVAAEGEWGAWVEVAGRLLRNLVKGDTGTVVRLGYSGGVLTVDGASFPAAVIEDEGDVQGPKKGRGPRIGR